VTGLANLAPKNFVLRMGFHGRGKAEYRIYLDNIVVRRADGSVVELYRDGPYKRGFKKSKAYPNASVKAVPLAKVQKVIESY